MPELKADGPPVRPAPQEPCGTCGGNGWYLFQYDRPGGIPGNQKVPCPDCQPQEPAPTESSRSLPVEPVCKTCWDEGTITEAYEEVWERPCPDCRGGEPAPEGQPAPKHGPASQPVEPVFMDMVDREIPRTFNYGLQKYKVPLHTFDGRRGDWQEEWVSLGRYVTALEMENGALAKLLNRAYVLLYELGSDKALKLAQDIDATGIPPSVSQFERTALADVEAGSDG